MDALQKTLDYSFRDTEHLARALRHSSRAAADSNERLEFLGDRVLGLVIAEMLVARHPHEQEGDLARRLAQLVSRDLCAEIAAGWKLGAHLDMAKAEKKKPLSRNVLADACEAVLGAIYLDGGLEAARHVILRHWKAFIEGQGEAPIDPKTRLQEWVGKDGGDLPVYEIVAQEGAAHAPRFTVRVSAGGRSAEGEGATRRTAEKAAATQLLAALGVETS